MQNRYAGDAGDFGKLALLKALAPHMKLGINWYLVEIPGEKTNDGRHVAYLDRPHSALYQCDSSLADRLKAIAHGRRSVSQLQKLLQGVAYYSAVLDPEGRKQWHEQALSTLKSCELVFLDPDNGLLVPSVGRKAPKSIKYIFEDEIAHYYSAGCSVFFYNHRSREPRKKYLGRFRKLFKNPAFEKALKFALTYSAYSVRDYIFIVQPRHKQTVEAVTAAFMNTGWGAYFKPLPLAAGPAESPPPGIFSPGRPPLTPDPCRCIRG